MPVVLDLFHPLVTVGHDVHDDIPVLSAYDQFAHAVGSTAPAAQDEPFGQIVHDVAVADA